MGYEYGEPIFQPHVELTFGTTLPEVLYPINLPHPSQDSETPVSALTSAYKKLMA